MGAMLLGIVEGNTLLQVLSGSSQLSEVDKVNPSARWASTGDWVCAYSGLSEELLR